MKHTRFVACLLILSLMLPLAAGIHAQESVLQEEGRYDLSYETPETIMAYIAALNGASSKEEINAVAYAACQVSGLPMEAVEKLERLYASANHITVTIDTDDAEDRAYADTLSFCGLLFASGLMKKADSEGAAVTLKLHNVWRGWQDLEGQRIAFLSIHLGELLVNGTPVPHTDAPITMTAPIPTDFLGKQLDVTNFGDPVESTVTGRELNVPVKLDEPYRISASIQSVTQNGVTYRLDYDGAYVASVTQITADAPANCVIPAEITHHGQTYTVRKLEYTAFRGNSKLTSLSLPATLQTIDEGTFPHAALRSIHVDAESPYFLTDADTALYQKNYRETRNGKNYIGYRLLQYTSAAAGSSYTVLSGTITIGIRAFYNAANLKSVTLPDSMVSVSAHAFRNCRSLEQLDLGGTRALDAQALANCSALTSLAIPAAMAQIAPDALLSCTGIRAFTVESGNTWFTAKDGVLYNADKTTLVAYPTSKQAAVYTVPASVVSIGYQVFRQAHSLQALQVEAGNPIYDAENGVLFSNAMEHPLIELEYQYYDDYALETYLGMNLGKMLHTYPCGKEDASYTLPAGVTSIAPYAFYGNRALTAVDLQDAAYVRLHAFDNCSHLQTFTADKLVFLGDYALCQNALEALTLSGSLRHMGEVSAQGLQTITFQGQTVPRGNWTASAYLPELTHIYVPAAAVQSYQNAAPAFAPKIFAIRTLTLEELRKRIAALTDDSPAEEIDFLAQAVSLLSESDFRQLTDGELDKVERLFRTLHPITLTLDVQGDALEAWKDYAVHGLLLAAGLPELVTAEQTHVVLCLQEPARNMGYGYVTFRFTLTVNGTAQNTYLPWRVDLPVPQALRETELNLLAYGGADSVVEASRSADGKTLRFTPDLKQDYGLYGLNQIYLYTDSAAGGWVMAALYEANGQFIGFERMMETRASSRGMGVLPRTDKQRRVFLVDAQYRPIGTITLY